MELSKTKTTLYASLSSKKMRQKYGLFLAEGEKCVTDTVGAFELECLIADPGWLERSQLTREMRGDKIFTASSSVIRKISTLATPPEVVAVFHIPQEDEKAISLDRKKLYLLLDGVQDPGNLGTIVRTADWFGVETIFASHDTVDVYNPKTVQSTMGSLQRVKIHYADLAELIKINRGMPVYGMTLDGENIYGKTEVEKGGMIIMGNEGNGISAELRNMITRPLTIPPYHKSRHPESLNVAIATAITLSIFREWQR